MRWLESIPKRSGISVFLPSTLLATEETIMLKTIKFGIFLRYLAIFKVDTVVVYLDDNDSKDYPLISALLSYSIAPPYLRKYLFKHKEQLKYAGSLFPLNICSHNPINVSSRTFIDDNFDIISNKFLKKYRSALDVNKIHFGDKYTGNYEELLLKPKKFISTKTLKRGIVINNPKNENKIILFIDPENIFEFEGDKGNILDYFEIFESEFPLLVKYKSEKFSSFDFKISDKNLIEIVEEFRKSSIIIGTSEYGVPYYSLISETIFSKPISLVFGPSKDGIEGTLLRVVKTNKVANNHIQPNKSLIKSMFDFYINTIPNQGTETVRLEEAVGSTLSLFNNEIEKKRKIEEERKKE
jgi:predicted SPOUT superfamily RNA methylase MTH1